MPTVRMHSVPITMDTAATHTRVSNAATPIITWRFNSENKRIQFSKCDYVGYLQVCSILTRSHIWYERMPEYFHGNTGSYTICSPNSEPITRIRKQMINIYLSLNIHIICTLINTHKVIFIYNLMYVSAYAIWTYVIWRNRFPHF